MSYHHGDLRRALLAAAAESIAEEGPAALRETRAATGSFLELGVTYVRFATTHRAHFEVMWRPDLYHVDDPALMAARERSGNALYAGVAELPDGHGGADVQEAGLAAWSLAHGFATLWLSGALPDMPDLPDEAARAVLRHLTRGD